MALIRWSCQRAPGSGQGLAGLLLALLLSPAVFADPPRVLDLSSYPDALIFEGVALDDDLGGGEIVACDIDADGIDDLVITADKGDGIGQARPDSGEAYVVYGARRRWSSLRSILAAASVRIVGQEALDSLGSGAVCADVNGDAHEDVLLEAFNADSVDNARNQAGQAHLIFGAPTLPALIDLAQPYGTVIYGAASGDAIGDEPAAGDVNGDGIADLVLDAAHATGRTGGQPQAGKVHILFGRATWPTAVDLRNQSDVTIHGATLNDNVGAQLACGDLDGDGITDLLIDAPGGDGPQDARSSCGDAFVFRGRRVWPAMIDLALPTTPPDMVVWGADAQDQFGRAGLEVGDLDADGSAELISGGPYADGPSETVRSQGEVRIAEPGTSLPSTLDLRYEFRSVIYGVDAGDTWGNRLQVGDINGDGIDDLIAGGARADGPGNARVDGGDVYVVVGRVGLPPDVRLADGEADMIVYGAEAQDRLSVGRFTTDINDDGLQELVLRARTGVGYGKLARVYLVSPYDVDGDGVSQLADNCPLVANALQGDEDADGRGDACALDWDGDGQTDGEDCAPNRPQDGTPGEVLGLRVSGAATAVVQWDPIPFATTYDVTRGALSQLSSTDLGACQNERDPDLTDTSFLETDLPPVGGGYFYLTRGRNAYCALSGMYGRTSAGIERINENPLACP